MMIDTDEQIEEKSLTVEDNHSEAVPIEAIEDNLEADTPKIYSEKKG